MSKEIQRYQYLVGMSKEEVLSVLNDELNHYPLDVWTYTLRRGGFFGGRKTLVLYFENSHVIKIKIKTYYGSGS